MNLTAKFHYFIILITLICLSCSEEESREERGVATEQVFTLLDANHTNVNFSNTLTEGPNTNILMYEYFYNGGGVAIGDLNGDQFEDVYFTANMSDNALYINKGDLKFEDVTKQSAAGGRSGPWKTGVNMVDINGDGKLDIYLCYSGSMPIPKRANQLFVNQGNDKNGVPQFIDQAEQYGLASTAFSNQSYFFDADNDGDLDMFLLNHNPKNLPILNEPQTKAMFAKDSPMMGSRLFIQDNGRFEDVTAEAGINGSELSYGLGTAISDVNQDGWSDIYVSNDYAVPDYLYINNKDGTFSNKLSDQIRYTSHFSMGNDIADINNDGLTDIVTLDMLPEDNARQKKLLAPDNYSKFDLHVRSGFYYQYMSNMLQLNNGNGSFSEIAQFAGISNTDWSWSALLADYNNNGTKDLYVTNGYNRDYTNLDFINYMDDYVKQKGRLIRQDVLQIINRMPSSNVVNYLFENTNGIQFQDKTLEWGLSDVSNSNGAAYADLDNDGDLDLVVNNVNKPAFIYENISNKAANNYLQIDLKGTGKNTLGIGATVTLISTENKFIVEQYPTRGYLSSVSPVLHFGLRDIKLVDTLIVQWPSGNSQIKFNVKANQRINLDENDAVRSKLESREVSTYFTEIDPLIDYTNPALEARDFDRQSLLIDQLSCNGPQFLQVDLNNDNILDLVIGGSKDQAMSIFLQFQNGSFRKINNSTFNKDKASEDSDMEALDANADGNIDLYVTSGGYHNYTSSDKHLQDRLYLGNGDGSFRKSINSLPEVLANHSSVVSYDFNGDSFDDIFIGGSAIPGRYPESSKSLLLLNDGKGNFNVATQSFVTELEDVKLVTDAKVADLNNDGRKELIVVGKWMPIHIFDFNEDVMTNVSSKYFNTEYSGWWNTIHISDVNDDAKPDLIIGNQGLNNQFSASQEKPLELYFSDFDKNGSVDPIFCYYVQGRSFPHLTRDELTKQLPKLKNKFSNYDEFGNASVSDIFSQEELKSTSYLKTNHLETSLFVQNENGVFVKSALPKEAQYSPVYSIASIDVDKDGISDLAFFGNNSKSSLRLGNYAANYGYVFRSKANGSFEYIPQYKSGLNIRGDVKDVLVFENTIIVGINQDKLVSYQLSN